METVGFLHGRKKDGHGRTGRGGVVFPWLLTVVGYSKVTVEKGQIIKPGANR